MNTGAISFPLAAAEHFAALSRVGTALMSELDETCLLTLIAQTACDLTGAAFAAFSLRSVNEQGQPLVPSEGHLFHLAAIVGVTPEQEALFRQMPLGEEGLLAPIFRYGVAVRVPDALEHIAHPVHHSPAANPRELYETAREAACAYAHGQLPSVDLRSLGVPRGHTIVRSFLGAPLLDHIGQVRGGLLLGHPEPGRFTQDDEALLIGLAAQAAVALENARLYWTIQMRAKELDAIFESITDGVTLIDHQGRILRENGIARRLREQLQAFPEGEHAIEALIYAPAKRALSGEMIQDITVTLGKSQHGMRDYLVNASPMRPPTLSGPLSLADGTTPLVDETQQPVVSVVVVWHEVTEARHLFMEQQDHAETESRRALLQLLLDELPTGVYLVRGYDARLVLANRAAAALWGANWPHDQPMQEFLKANDIRIFGIDGLPLPPEQLAAILAMQQGKLVRHLQKIIRHSDGTTLPILVSAVAFDVSELHLLPSTRTVHSHQEVEPAALVVYQDVTALKEAERIKDEFISIATHELRNPMSVLKGFAQTLLMQTLRGKGPALVEWQVKALREIDQAVTRLDKLTEDLLDVTRLQAGRLVLYCEPTDLVALTRRMMKRLQMTTLQHQLSLHTALSYLVLHVDPGRIEQVLSNLIGNAIKYSPASGTIEIILREDAEAHVAQLSIQDHGIGIPADERAHIFSRFARAGNAQVSGIAGTGLGLFICRELIERHEGRIWFESAEGVGSTFYITLPVVPEGAPFPASN